MIRRNLQRHGNGPHNSKKRPYSETLALPLLGACLRPSMTPFSRRSAAPEPPHSLAAIAPSACFSPSSLKTAQLARATASIQSFSRPAARALAGNPFWSCGPPIADPLASLLASTGSCPLEDVVSRPLNVRYCRGYFGPRLIRACPRIFLNKPSEPCRCRLSALSLCASMSPKHSWRAASVV